MSGDRGHHAGDLRVLPALHSRAGSGEQLDGWGSPVPGLLSRRGGHRQCRVQSEQQPFPCDFNGYCTAKPVAITLLIPGTPLPPSPAALGMDGQYWWREAPGAIVLRFCSTSSPSDSK